jgi:hypothetical protein
MIGLGVNDYLHTVKFSPGGAIAQPLESSFGGF